MCDPTPCLRYALRAPRHPHHREPSKSPSYDRFLGILDSKDKIPYTRKIGKLHYNLWRDENNLKGLWRRTTLDEYVVFFFLGGGDLSRKKKAGKKKNATYSSRVVRRQRVGSSVPVPPSLSGVVHLPFARASMLPICVHVHVHVYVHVQQQQQSFCARGPIYGIWLAV